MIVTYKQAKKILNERCDPGFPVQVRRIKFSTPDFGHCSWDHDDQVYRIKLRNDLVEVALVDVLIHEWAHTLSWSAEEHHGPEWGVAYARCYREVFDTT